MITHKCSIFISIRFHFPINTFIVFESEIEINRKKCYSPKAYNYPCTYLK